MQRLHQFATLKEIADLLEKHLVEAKELKLKGDWTAQLEDGDKPKALQLIVYATMVLATLSPEEGEKGVLAAIRSGRNVREGLLSLRIEGEPAGTRTLLPIVARARGERQAGRNVDRAFKIGADGLGLDRTALQVIPAVKQVGGKIGTERNIEILREVDRRDADFAKQFFLEIHRTA